MKVQRGIGDAQDDVHKQAYASAYATSKQTMPLQGADSDSHHQHRHTWCTAPPSRAPATSRKPPIRVKRTLQLGTGAGSTAPSAPASTRRQYCSAPLAACAHSDGRVPWLAPACVHRLEVYSPAQPGAALTVKENALVGLLGGDAAVGGNTSTRTRWPAMNLSVASKPSCNYAHSSWLMLCFVTA